MCAGDRRSGSRPAGRTPWSTRRSVPGSGRRPSDDRGTAGRQRSRPRAWSRATARYGSSPSRCPRLRSGEVTWRPSYSVISPGHRAHDHRGDADRGLAVARVSRPPTRTGRGPGPRGCASDLLLPREPCDGPGPRSATAWPGGWSRWPATSPTSRPATSSLAPAASAPSTPSQGGGPAQPHRARPGRARHRAGGVRDARRDRARSAAAQASGPWARRSSSSAAGCSASSSPSSPGRPGSTSSWWTPSPPGATWPSAPGRWRRCPAPRLTSPRGSGPATGGFGADAVIVTVTTEDSGGRERRARRAAAGRRHRRRRPVRHGARPRSLVRRAGHLRALGGLRAGPVRPGLRGKQLGLPGQHRALDGEPEHGRVPPPRRRRRRRSRRDSRGHRAARRGGRGVRGGSRPRGFRSPECSAITTQRGRADDNHGDDQ